MRVISNKTLKIFSAAHPAANSPLQHWRKNIEKHTFTHFTELKAVFNSVDKVGEYCVFNLGGNKYRLIAFVQFTKQQCFIKQVLTHKEYDQGNWK